MPKATVPKAPTGQAQVGAWAVRGYSPLPPWALCFCTSLECSLVIWLLKKVLLGENRYILEIIHLLRFLFLINHKPSELGIKSTLKELILVELEL